jgi:hypothetical protein
MERSLAIESEQDPYVRRFLSSPVYVMVLRDTIDTAATSYKVARILSIVLFVIGAVLIGAAFVVGLVRENETLSLIFGGLGTANIIALLLYRPIDRVQSGVDALIKSQISCLSFMAQYDSVARTLATMGQMPLKEINREEQLRLAEYLKETSSQLMSDLRRDSLN